MKKIFGIVLVSSLFSIQIVFAYGVGYSSFPLMTDKKIVSTELSGILSAGGGLGVQARYSQKINRAFLVDAGLGVSGGQRNMRAFAGVDYELYPDYKKQPKISVKATMEYANEFSLPHNKISLIPTVSKGLSFWGHEGFPYVALPIGLSLELQNKTYETEMNLSMGISGKLPLKNYNHLTANAEAVMSLKDSYSGLFLGVSYPLN